MANVIQDKIDEIAAYIDSCKPMPLSSSLILVDRETIDDYLASFRDTVPDEMRRYQKIISNKEEILQDAKKKANEIIEEANQFVNSSVNEHEIMQQAYAQAGEIVEDAKKQAQYIIQQANIEADNIHMAAIDYTDASLANIESVLSNAIDTSIARNDAFVMNLRQYLQKVVADRAELNPDQEDLAVAERAEAERIAAQNAGREYGGVSLDMVGSDTDE